MKFLSAPVLGRSNLPKGQRVRIRQTTTARTLLARGREHSDILTDTAFNHNPFNPPSVAPSGSPLTNFCYTVWFALGILPCNRSLCQIQSQPNAACATAPARKPTTAALNPACIIWNEGMSSYWQRAKRTKPPKRCPRSARLLTKPQRPAFCIVERQIERNRGWR